MSASHRDPSTAVADTDPFDAVEGSLSAEPPDVEQARSELTRIARSAAEVSDTELASLAALLADLLLVSASASTAGCADELVEFCRSSAPLLRASAEQQGEASGQTAAVRQRAEERWGEYLELLAPEERSLPPEDWGGDFGDEEFSEDDTAPAGAFDIDRILSSLPHEETPRTENDHDDPFSGRPASEAVGTPAPLEAPPPPERSAIDVDLLPSYVDDAEHCLGGMEQALLKIESEPLNNESLRQFCRELHTLKGASGTVGLGDLASYLHRLEDRVEQMEAGNCAVDVDLLLNGVDVVRSQLATLQGRSPSEDARAPSARRSPGSVASAGDGEDFVRIEAARLDRLMDLLAELVMMRNRRDTYLSQLKELHHELQGCAKRIRTCGAQAVSLPVRQETEGSHLFSRSLGETADDVAELNRTLREVVDPLENDNGAVSHLIGQFRQELTEMRRLPVTGLFRRLQRAARDAAKIEHKQVELEFRGQGTRAERLLQDRLFEPLMHVVRNAVSHGIEQARERLAAGKPETGRIVLEAHSTASALFLEVRDDGRGLDEEALERRGRELGLLPAGEAVSPERLWKLIFHPGFSTRTEVNEIAGRGVGMDVVASRIRELRGRLDVRSTPGQGSLLRLQIPLRSPIEHAMVVRVEGQLFALPVQSVHGIGQESNGNGHPANGRTDDVSGDPPPPPGAASSAPSGAVDLGELLGLRKGAPSHPQILTLRQHGLGAGNGSSSTPGSRSSTPSQLSIAVDSVIGVEEVVVRSLPPMLRGHELFSGVTLSGDAETVLLFDVPLLVDRGLRHDRTAGADSSGAAEDRRQGEPSSGRREETAAGRILVVDDSLSVRRQLVRKLQERGWQTAEAGDGLQALDLLRAGDFSGVVTDVDMPRLSGVELLSEIRRRQKLQGLPVVVVTSRNDEATLDRLHQLQAKHILSKPVTDSMLTMALASFLNRQPD